MKSPFKPALVPVLAGLIGLSVSGLAQADHSHDRARVIRSTPIVEQVPVPHEVCYNETVTRPGGRTGAGAIIGGIAGGAVGHAIGHGHDRTLATVIGAVGGAVVGNHIENPRPARAEVVRHCSTQTRYENRTVGYDVVYRYEGVKYRVQMPQDPGRFVRVDTTPTRYDRPYRHDHRPGAVRGAVVHQVMHASEPQPYGWQ